jgi:uncharacterized protein with PQ loop repeat
VSFPLSQHLKTRNNPHRKRGALVGVLDRSMYLVVLLPPIMTIPQVLTIWIDRQTEGISLMAWLTYFLVLIFWTIYGVIHKEKLITFTNGLWIIINLFVVIGITK